MEEQLAVVDVAVFREPVVGWLAFMHSARRYFTSHDYDDLIRIVASDARDLGYKHAVIHHYKETKNLIVNLGDIDVPTVHN